MARLTPTQYHFACLYQLHPRDCVCGSWSTPTAPPWSHALATSRPPLPMPMPPQLHPSLPQPSSQHYQPSTITTLPTLTHNGRPPNPASHGPDQTRLDRAPPPRLPRHRPLRHHRPTRHPNRRPPHHRRPARRAASLLQSRVDRRARRARPRVRGV